MAGPPPGFNPPPVSDDDDDDDDDGDGYGYSNENKVQCAGQTLDDYCDCGCMGCWHSQAHCLIRLSEHDGFYYIMLSISYAHATVLINSVSLL